jgi:hypothetical protein
MAIEKVVNLKVNDDIQDTTKNVVSLKTQLRQAQNEVNELSARFGATSEQAVNAARRAAELADAIGDARALTDAFNPDAKFKALTATLGGVAGGFSAVQGAIGLMGKESEDVEKMILKVQSAMALAQGVDMVLESVDAFKILGSTIKNTTLFQKALSAATAIQTFVTNGATLAAKALRGALVATGVGALVVGIGLLIANFDKVKKVVLNLVPQLAMVGDVVMSIVNAVTDFVGATSEAERAADRAKTNAEKRSKDIDRILKEDGSRYSESAKKKMAIEKQLQDDIAEGLYNETKLRKEAAFAIAQIDKENADNAKKKAKEEQDKIDAKNKEARDKRKEERDRLKKEAQDIADNAKKANEEISKTDLERLTEKYEKELTILKKQKVSTLDLEIKFLNDKNDLALKQQEIEYKLAEEKKAKEEKDAKDKKEKDEENAKEQIAIEQSVADAKKSIQDSQLNNISAGISLLQNLGIKNKAIQKGLMIAESAAGIAKIVINTQAANAAATLKYALLPGGQGLAAQEIIANKISAGIGIASNIAATAKALSALGGGGVGGSSANIGSGGGQAPAPPQFNIVGQSGTNQLAQTIAGKQNQPIEAFVVSSAVTTSQALDRNRVKTATFGN